MEIIFKKTAEKSNFGYCADIFKGKEKLNGFNKMIEELEMCEYLDDKDFHVRNVKFEEPIDGKLYLCYPLSVVVEEDVHFDSLHSLITEIRKAYKKIYRAPIKYGVWGHYLGDLVIESITIYEDNLIDVSIGS